MCDGHNMDAPQPIGAKHKAGASICCSSNLSMRVASPSPSWRGTSSTSTLANSCCGFAFKATKHTKRTETSWPTRLFNGWLLIMQSRRRSRVILTGNTMCCESHPISGCGSSQLVILGSSKEFVDKIIHATTLLFVGLLPLALSLMETHHCGRVP